MHDEEHGTEYVACLRTYLDHKCNIPATARVLLLHVNTLRYRLEKLTELFDIDLDNPHQRLALGIQLWLMPSPDKETEQTS